jgi:hypothetical protein
MEDYNVPIYASVIHCINITVKDMIIEGKWNVFVWKDDDTFNFCGSNENDEIKRTTLPIKDIKYYTRKGDYKVETTTKGGGVNFVRAIIIGLVCAFIGSMIGDFIDVINFRIFTSSGLSTILAIILFVLGVLLGGKNKMITINKEIDNRKTYLYYFEDGKNKQIVFTSNAYDELMKLIPEKEMSYIENNKILDSGKTQNDTIYTDIEKLAELRDKSILTEEEFNKKKQSLLDKIH